MLQHDDMKSVKEVSDLSSDSHDVVLPFYHSRAEKEKVNNRLEALAAVRYNGQRRDRRSAGIMDPGSRDGGTMARYYIADQHFYHMGLLKRMDCRGFQSVQDMNEYMIRQWNAKVKKTDEVVILGDFSFGGGEETAAVAARLKGRLYLIKGNHDQRYLAKQGFTPERFEWVREYTELSDNSRKVVLCHYPVLFYNGQYRMDAAGNPRTYMLYGQVHDTPDEQLMERFIAETRSTVRAGHDGEDIHIPCNMVNCFAMYSDYVPLTLDEWLALNCKGWNLDEIRARAAAFHSEAQ